VSESRVAVVIEDQPDLRELTELVLTQSGFTVVTAADGPAGINAVRDNDPILTTLDVNMPGMDGFAVAKQLRTFSETYLIMITGRADEIDVVSGFEAGADDYIVKPFSTRELRARADSMLRRPRRMSSVAAVPAPETPSEPEPEPETWVVAAARELRESPLAPMAAASVVDMATATPSVFEPSVTSSDGAASAAGQSATVLGINGLTLDATTGIARVGSQVVDLTEPERELLASLLSTGRRVRSKADLVLALRGQPYVTSYFVKEIDKKNVDRHISSLRSKLGDDGATPKFIETVRGVGYRLAHAS
jgi:two-component system, OmpR family, response regulator